MKMNLEFLEGRDISDKLILKGVIFDVVLLIILAANFISRLLIFPYNIVMCGRFFVFESEKLRVWYFFILL